MAEGEDSQLDRGGIWKLQRELDEMKCTFSNTLKNFMEDVKETLEMERKKGNQTIHRMPETDVEYRVWAVAKMLMYVNCMPFARNVEKMK